LESRRGGKALLKLGYQPQTSEISLHYGAQRRVRFLPAAHAPVELLKLASKYFDEQQELRPEAFSQFEVFLSRAGEIDDKLVCHDDVLAFVAEVRDVEQRRQRLDEAFPRGMRSAAFKNLLKLPLYDYQREGALFAARAGRSLLGDEMGLGKTMQAIAATEIMARSFGVERVLVVCPTSLKHQWEREIARATDRTATVIGGLRPKRQEQFAEASFYKITNYDTVHRDLEQINAWSPDLVILDEAQRIKNWETRAARTVKKIASPYCIVLSGTPLENRLEELVSIVQFIDQHRLGPTFRFLHQHQIREEETGRVVGYCNLDGINRTLEPILLRRRKQQVLSQLPERLEKQFFVPMTDQQRSHHEENMETVARIVQKWRRYGFLSESDQRRLMISLQNMRMACDSTYLLDHKNDSSVKPDDFATLLDELLEQPETKVVVFSQWLRMHELLERRLKERGIDYVLFHGGVASEQRKHLVDRFREEPGCRVFLSTDAGGVGLNLQHANVVVNMDLPWNPAVLEQRIGRVHRLGQTQPVQVYNFIAQGTIEESMLSLLKFKKSLFAGVLDGGEKEVFLGGSRLKRFMETVENVTTAIPDSSPPDEPSVLEDEPLALPASSQTAANTDGRATENGGGKAAAPGAPSNQAAAVSNDPLAALVSSGLALLEQLGQAAAQPGSSSAARGGSPRGVQVVRGSGADEAYLQIRLPQPEALAQLVQGVRQLLLGTSN
jgi:SNF2 family DNA or RNA helicase